MLCSTFQGAQTRLFFHLFLSVCRFHLSSFSHQLRMCHVQEAECGSVCQVTALRVHWGSTFLQPLRYLLLYSAGLVAELCILMKIWGILAYVCIYICIHTTCVHVYMFVHISFIFILDFSFSLILSKSICIWNVHIILHREGHRIIES